MARRVAAMVILAALGPAPMGCVLSDSFMTAQPYPTSVHEPGFWRDLSGMERTTHAANSLAIAPPASPDSPPAPVDFRPIAWEQPDVSRLAPIGSQPRLNRSGGHQDLGGLSMSIDDVMRKLDELVDESMAVQQGLLKLRLRGTPKNREQQDPEPKPKPEPAQPDTKLAAQ